MCGFAGATTFITMTFGIRTLSIIAYLKLSEHNVIRYCYAESQISNYAECPYAECHYDECRGASKTAHKTIL